MALSRLRVWVITATAVWLSLLAMDSSRSCRVSAQPARGIPSSPPSGQEAALSSAYSPPSPEEVTLFQSWLVQSSVQARSRSNPSVFVSPQELALFGGPGDTGVTSATPGVLSVGSGSGAGAGAGGQGVITGGGRRRSRSRRRRRRRSLLTVDPPIDGDQHHPPPPPPPPPSLLPAARRELKQPASSPSPPPRNTTGTSNAANSSSSSSSTPGVDAVVAKDGSGQFTTVQAAVNAAPGNKRYVVLVKRGTYVEKLAVSKGYVTLRGEGPYLTKLTYNDTAGSAGGTSLSASVTVTGKFFSAEDLEFANGSPRPDTSSRTGQAVAFRITGDQAAFYNCRFIGYQDTLYSHRGRHYFKNCYIRGSVDFIFGDGTAMFLDSDLYADVIDKGGYLTAQNRGTATSTTGFVFLRCKVNGNGLVYLGRPWGNSARTVFAYTYMSDVVKPAGWNDWGKNVTKLTVFYGEYKNTGPGAATGLRETWAFQLTDAQAKPFLTVDFIGGKSWIPQSGLKGLTGKNVTK
ncbi:hypothetical protein CBR_g39186 [Chara braunii]|uniref:Pectinesterase n=1 Tax=Chara braunii TaxID=69332 RepID=A0A388LR53_CHABU|nr:hypothetical protein CBR_g39186 [Chara braunii]|eukprot:GBG84810.1 hypothetical protein CBR_g39186 [Chara braunii]